MKFAIAKPTRTDYYPSVERNRVEKIIDCLLTRDVLERCGPGRPTRKISTQGPSRTRPLNFRRSTRQVAPLSLRATAF
jgi:hypothetical protein